MYDICTVCCFFCFVVSMGMKKPKMYFYGSETISD